MKYARSCTCSKVGRWGISFGVFASDLGLASDLAFETDVAFETGLAFETDLALLLFRGFLVSVAGAGGADAIAGAVNATAGSAATETGSVLLAFLRTARFGTRFFFVFSSISQLSLVYKLTCPHFNPLVDSVK